MQSLAFWLLNVLLSAAAMSLGERSEPQVLAALFVGALFAIVLLAFTLQLALAPFRQRNEARGEIEHLREEIRDLAPRVTMTHTSKVEWTHHHKEKHSHAVFSISMANRGEATVSRPRVRAYLTSVKDYARIQRIIDNQYAASIPKDGVIKFNMNPTVPHVYDPQFELIVATILDCTEGRFSHFITINPKTKLPSTPTLEQARAFIPHLEKLVGGTVGIG